MTIAEILNKMICYSDGNIHDISHFIKVHSYAKLIGELEEVDEHTLRTIEMAAIVHDIACPLCRKKYGNTEGKHQEEESEPLVREFFLGTDTEENVVDRVIYLVSHHHTINDIDGVDYQILIEADYLVNADESQFSKNNIKNMHDKVFKTKTGKELLEKIYMS